MEMESRSLDQIYYKQWLEWEFLYSLPFIDKSWLIAGRWDILSPPDSKSFSKPTQLSLPIIHHLRRHIREFIYSQ